MYSYKRALHKPIISTTLTSFRFNLDPKLVEEILFQHSNNFGQGLLKDGASLIGVEVTERTPIILLKAGARSTSGAITQAFLVRIGRTGIDGVAHE